MTYDALRQRVVLYGGNQAVSGSTAFTDTWEWDGNAWQDKTASTLASIDVAMAYDSSRQRVVQFGGKAPGNAVLNGTWAYAVLAAQAYALPYGSGCAGPTGVSALIATTVPRLGTTFSLSLNNLPNGFLNVAFGWIGFDDTSWNGLPLPLPLGAAGFPGCTALLAPSVAYTLTNNNGSALWQLPIPFLPVFAGAEFYLQGGVLVLGFNPGGMVFSNAQHAVLGG